MAKKDKGVLTGAAVSYPIPSPAGGVRMKTFIPWTLVKHGVRREVITPLDASESFCEKAFQARQDRQAAQDTPVIRALGLAHYWQRLLEDGTYRSITEIAAAEGLDLGQASHIARLALLAPEIVEACVAGEDGAPILERLFRRSFPADWSMQKHETFPLVA